MKLGDKFHVQVMDDLKFDAELIAIRGNDKDREFELKLTNRFLKDVKGRWQPRFDTFIEVEKAWFDNPKRKIIKQQLDLFK